MKVVRSMLSLPEKFRMIEITGATEAERMATARQIASTTNHISAWYIERKGYKASCAYLFLEVG